MPRAIEFAIVPSSLGDLLIAASEKGVCQVRFADPGVDLEEELAREFPFAELRENPIRLEPWSDALMSYVDGHSTRLEVSLDVSGSRFERRVWAAQRAIPRGETQPMAKSPARSASRRVPGPWGGPARATLSRWRFPATGWWRRAANWAATAGGSHASGTCWSARRRVALPRPL